MKQASLKLKIYAQHATNMDTNVRQLLLNIVFWSFGMLAVLYIVLLGTMVSNIVQRRNLETHARTLFNEVSNLELTYLSLSNNIDLNLSHSLGFKETPITFATRKALGLRPLNEPLGNIKTIRNDI